jgi:HPt (histidine-containing phosphotransfer) domain-containing protein
MSIHLHTVPLSTVPGELDRKALERLAALDPKGENHLVERVLQTFQTSAERLMKQLEAALLKGDHATIRLVAHTLKSSSASIGAEELSRACLKVEARSREGMSAELHACIGPMRHAMRAALEAIGILLEIKP